MIEVLLAQVLNFDNSFNERLGALCDKKFPAACELLVQLTGGNCAAVEGSGCHYTSTVTKRAVDNGLMVDDPYFGPSRIETVNFCLEEVGVERYQDMITDTHFEVYEACMIEHT